MKKALLIVTLLFITILNAQQQFTVYFDTGMDYLTAESDKEFQSWILKNKNIRVLKIYGYTDKHSTSEKNLTLSQRRADHVFKKMLVYDYAPEEDIDIKGFGETATQSGDDKQQRKVVIWYESRVIEKASVKAEELSIEPEVTVTKFSLGRQNVKAKVGDRIRLKSLGFFPGADKVLPECYPILEDLFKTMQDNPKLKIQIQGHICCYPSATNSLARARAETIYIYLVQKGIAKSRLSYTDFGGSRPVCAIPEKNEMEREVNRRVEIEIIEN